MKLSNSKTYDKWIGVAMVAAGLALNAAASHAQDANDRSKAVKPGDKVFASSAARNRRAQDKTIPHYHKARRMEAQALADADKQNRLDEETKVIQTLRNPYPRYNSSFITETRRYRRDLDVVYTSVNRPGNNSNVYWGPNYW